MSTVVLIKPTPHGDKGFPVDLEDVQRMVERGEAQFVQRNVYRMCAVKSQSYQTRDLKADRDAKPSWRSFKKAAGEALGKDSRKVTKADVEEYLNGVDR